MPGDEVFNTARAEEMQVNLEKYGLRAREDYSADGNSLKKMAKATYDFEVDGGAIGAIGLGVTIPDNAVITRAWVDVITTLTSATDAATIALHANAANDLVSAIAISDVSNPWDAGLQEGIPVDSAATAIKLTAARELTATVAVEALTAGKFVLMVEYMITE